jgi:hypothetical protein
MVGIRSPDGLVFGSCTRHPGVLGSIPKREEPGKTGAPCVKVPGSSRVPLVVSHSTCPPLSSSPHAHSFVIGPAVIKHTHTMHAPSRTSLLLPPPFTQSPSPSRSLVRDGQPSPHRPRLVVSRSTCPPISPPPHVNSFEWPLLLDMRELLCRDYPSPVVPYFLLPLAEVDPCHPADHLVHRDYPSPVVPYFLLTLDVVDPCHPADHSVHFVPWRMIVCCSMPLVVLCFDCQ